MFFLTPLLLSSILLTMFSNLIFNETTYQKILNDPEVSSQMTDAAVAILRDQVIAKSIGFDTFLKTDNANKLLKDFVGHLKLPQLFSDNLTNIVKYVNGKSDSLDSFVGAQITDEDINSLKQIIVELYSDYFVNLPRCSTDAEYNKQVQQSEVPNCRPPSQTTENVISTVRSSVNSSIDTATVKETLSGKIPISSDISSRLTQLSDMYKLVQLSILVSWIATIVLVIILILINVWGSITFPGYLASAALSSAVFVGVIGVLAQLGSNSINLQVSDLHLTAEYSLDVVGKFARLLNSIFKNLFTQVYYNMYVCAGVLLLIAIILYILKFVLRARKETKSEMKKEYYIPAYSTPVTPATTPIVKTEIEKPIERPEEKPDPAELRSPLRSDDDEKPTPKSGIAKP